MRVKDFGGNSKIPAITCNFKNVIWSYHNYRDVCNNNENRMIISIFFFFSVIEQMTSATILIELSTLNVLKLISYK